MIAIISPAKTLDFESNQVIGETSMPFFIESAERVNRKLRKLSRSKLGALQSISAQLASLNYQRNQDWNTDHTYGTRQAALCFKGDVYLGMQAESWQEMDMNYAADHLYILSGLYGILRPTDLIKPYRLEMGTALPVGRRKDLYHFWSDRIKKFFKDTIDKDELIVNLASNEYFKAVKASGVKNPVLDIEFKDFSNGSYKILSFFAKKARGMMADYIVRNQIDNPEALKAFNSESYYFDAKSSTADKFVFLRDKK
jgi:cytoplasmic iron level regulating protein YaaA (DUF328/UPF0246 family)